VPNIFNYFSTVKEEEIFKSESVIEVMILDCAIFVSKNITLKGSNNERMPNSKIACARW
jgi:hypothetical protein